MSALIGYGGVVAFLAIAAIAMVVLVGRRRRPVRSRASRSEPAQSDDTAATGYVPGVWMLGGAESAAPGDHAHGHHGLDAGGSHAADAGGGTGDSGASDGGGGGGSAD